MQRGFRHGLPGCGLNPGRQLGDPVAQSFELGAGTVGMHGPGAVRTYAPGTVLCDDSRPDTGRGN